jgi:hypothetical protein
MAAADPEQSTPARPDSLPSLASESLALDGWVEPVRLGNAWARSSRGPVSLIRASAAVTPAPWNVDRAVSLP